MLNPSTMTVDPGMNTGWAFWLDKEQPQASGVFRFRKIKNSTTTVTVQLQEMWMQFDNLLSFLKPKYVILENNAWWPGDTRSLAAVRSGDLRKLTLLTGGYCLQANRIGALWEMVEPVTWKGQLTDTALGAQILEITGKEYRKHEQEAVGIGLWKAGRL